MTKVLNQKGANGLIAEYQCAVAVCKKLMAQKMSPITSLDELITLRDTEIKKFDKELTSDQIERAKRQGNTLGEYICEKLENCPTDLGLDDFTLNKITSFNVTPSGHYTVKNDSSDVIIEFVSICNNTSELKISLKAYRSSVSSLGSKGAKASLARLFLGKNKISDNDFITYFGVPANNFVNLLKEFKATAKEFYKSPHSIKFLDEYEARKGTRKVNNPLRRKEVGDYFESKFGFKSEHKFAEYYVEMFNLGFSKIETNEQWQVFVNSMKFVLGMDNNILTLNAVDSNDNLNSRVINSLLCNKHKEIVLILMQGCDFKLTDRKNSIIGLDISHGDRKTTSLQLAIWKDATIQFKLDSSANE